jgi:hypothetical protein
MMIWAMSSGVRGCMTTVAIAGVLMAIPTAAVSIPADATPGFAGTSNTLAPYGVHPAQPPAPPSTDAPEPPTPTPEVCTDLMREEDVYEWCPP